MQKTLTWAGGRLRLPEKTIVDLSADDFIGSL